MENAEMARLLAENAIRKAILRYCRGFDRFDADMVASTWHEGGTADYGASLFNGTGKDFVAWCWPQHEPATVIAHQVMNTLIEVDGHRAASETYVRGVARYEDEQGRTIELVNYGRYLDQWSYRNDRWAVDHRRYVQDFGDEREVHDTRFSHEGCRDGSDPSRQLTPSLDPTRERESMK